MNFTPEALKEIESVIADIVEKKTQEMKRELAIAKADINALRTLAHKGIDE